MVFLLPFLTVLLSLLIVFVVPFKEQNLLKLFLAFSGAFLLALTFFELLPEVYTAPNPKTLSIFILSGVLFQIFLEFFSKGAEHGHMHAKVSRNQFPYLLFFSLSLHALIEGFPLHSNDTMVYGVVIHKLPVALILGLFLMESGLQKMGVVLFMLLFALMTPIGSYLAQNFSLFNKYSLELKALASGVFFHVSTTILFESAQNHAFNYRKLIGIILGVLLAYFM